MKKLIFAALIAVPLVSEINAEADLAVAAKNARNYISMEQKHKDKWFDFSKGYHDAKLDIMKKHKRQIMDVVKSNIATLGKTDDAAVYLSNQTDEMIALHEKHLEEWRNLSQAWEAKGRQYYEAEKAELAKFKASIE